MKNGRGVPTPANRTSGPCGRSPASAAEAVAEHGREAGVAVHQHVLLDHVDAGRECRREVVTATQRHGEAARHFLRVDVLDAGLGLELVGQARARAQVQVETVDRKSTRLNSSHVKISYAVFCLKKKRNQTQN